VIALAHNQPRQYELDWLRVIAILAVFVYHCSLIFAPDPYLIKNPTIYPYLDDIGDLIGLWGMPLIFIISGASVFHALGKVKPGKYVLGIIHRLIVPLVIGMFTHCAFQVYIEALHKGTFTGSFFEFYPHYFDGLYAFGGNFAWMGMHLWYLEALFLFSILCLPLYLWLKKRNTGQYLLQHIGNFFGRPAAIYLLVLPVAVLGYLLNPEDLGTTVLGGWSIFAYFVFFISGFVIVSSPRIQVTIKRLRWVSLVMGVFLWGVFDPIWGALGDPDFGTWQFVIGSTIWCLCAWCWILAVLGFGFEHLNQNKPFLRYANEAVLPFYILHQPVIVALAFFVVRWTIPDWFKFLVILSASFGIVMVIYEFMVRRFNPVRILFGMKLNRRIIEALSEEHQVAEPAHTA
jgi:peptidoglycan/LPS O-acetylase OafA/YrhL